MSTRWAVGCILATPVFVWRAWPSLWTTVDDAWISARYARHAAEGYGLVYNAGEPPIEGYTNLLWTLWLAVGIALDVVRADVWMVFSGLALGILGVGFAGLLARELVPEDRRESAWWVPGLASLLVALDVHHAVIATNGLESGMFVTAVLGAAWAVLATRGRSRWLAGLAVAALGAIRPEGFVVGAILVAMAGVEARRAGAPIREGLVPVGAVLGGVAGLLEVWRYLTYGAWVPNTFPAKAEGGLLHHLEANIRYLSGDGVFWIGVAIAGVLAVGLSWRDLRRWCLALAALSVVVVAFRVSLWMPGGRLLVAPYMLLLVVVAAGATTRPGQALGVTVLLGMLVAPFTSIENRVRRYDQVHSVVLWNGTAVVAEHIARHAPEGSWLAIRDAGVFAHFVGTGVKVAELHHRALTQLHPDGRDADVASYTPRNPEFIVLTQAREDAPDIRYGGDRIVMRRATEPYRYLGRVHQHHHRYYDVYVRADLDFPDLPKPNVVNFAGPAAPNAPDHRRR